MKANLKPRRSKRETPKDNSSPSKRRNVEPLNLQKKSANKKLSKGKRRLIWLRKLLLSNRLH